MRSKIFWFSALAMCTVLPLAHADDIPRIPDGFVSIDDSKVVYRNEPSLQVGGFGEGPDQLGGADTVEVDRQGNVYVVDDVQRQIKIWRYRNRTGQVHEIIDSGDVEAAVLGPLAWLH